MGRNLVTPRSHSPKGDLPKVACGLVGIRRLRRGGLFPEGGIATKIAAAAADWGRSRGG